MSLTNQDIDAVCALVQDLCGIALDESKSYLIENRLADLLRREKCASYADLAIRARSAMATTLQREIVDAMTTNETLFFRDGAPFEALRHKVLPELIDTKLARGGGVRLRIWSAACSAGQEPYSLAMTLCELAPQVADWDVQILATDISDAMIRRASRGWYAAHEVERGLPEPLRSRYFVPEENGWRVKDSLRYLVRFERRNLLEPLSGVGTFDIVFCRNVAIYFTPDDRRRVFLNLADTLYDDGYLFVGSQESLLDLGPRFRPHEHCRATFYRPNLPQPAGVR